MVSEKKNWSFFNLGLLWTPHEQRCNWPRQKIYVSPQVVPQLNNRQYWRKTSCFKWRFTVHRVVIGPAVLIWVRCYMRILTIQKTEWSRRRYITVIIIYSYIYMCVCVCVCVCPTFSGLSRCALKKNTVESQRSFPTVHLNSSTNLAYVYCIGIYTTFFR
jgi:hypothetical protein